MALAGLMKSWHMRAARCAANSAALGVGAGAASREATSVIVMTLR
jgi:hypothetical protein